MVTICNCPAKFIIVLLKKKTFWSQTTKKWEKSWSLEEEKHWKLIQDINCSENRPKACNEYSFYLFLLFNRIVTCGNYDTGEKNLKYICSQMWSDGETLNLQYFKSGTSLVSSADRMRQDRILMISWIPLNLSFRYILFHEKRLQTMLWHCNARVNSHQRWKQTRFRVCFHL